MNKDIIFQLSFQAEFIGVLYVFWAILDVKTGHAYIIKDVRRGEGGLRTVYREDEPVEYWGVMGACALFELLLIYANDIKLDIPYGIIPIPFQGSTL